MFNICQDNKKVVLKGSVYTAPRDRSIQYIFFLFLPENISRVERKTDVSLMVVFPQT